MSNENEYQYMQTDDTVNVDKKNLPVESRDVSELKEKCIKEINSFVKENYRKHNHK